MAKTKLPIKLNDKKLTNDSIKDGRSPATCPNCSKSASKAAAKSGKQYLIKVITEYLVKLVCLG